MFLEIEAELALLAVVLAFIAPNLGSREFETLERHFNKFAERRGPSVLVMGLGARVVPRTENTKLVIIR